MGGGWLCGMAMGHSSAFETGSFETTCYPVYIYIPIADVNLVPFSLIPPMSQIPMPFYFILYDHPKYKLWNEITKHNSMHMQVPP